VKRKNKQKKAKGKERTLISERHATDNTRQLATEGDRKKSIQFRRGKHITQKKGKWRKK